MDEPFADPRDELLDIAASVRALLGLYESTGAWGLPPEERSFAPAPAPAPRAAEQPRQTAPVAQGEASYEPRRAPAAASPGFFAPPTPGAQTPRPTHAGFQTNPTQTNPAPAQARPAGARPEALTPEARIHRLEVIASDVASCTRCRLADGRTKTVFSRGNPLAELCFVGEGPGHDEDLSGEPFVGAAGQLLDKMIAAMGYRRDEVYICNIVKCRPPENRKPQPDEMAACKPFLAQQIELVRPKYIVALGATAIQGLLGTTEGIMRLRGNWKMYRGIPVMPTYHPAYLLRTPTAKREVWSDLQQVMARLGKLPPSRA